MSKATISKYKIKVNPEKLYRGEKHNPVRIAILSDMHGRPYDSVINTLVSCAPDLIVAPGDIIEHQHRGHDLGLSFLAEAGKIAPLFFSCGNHEKTLSGSEIKALCNAGVHLVDNIYEAISVGDARLLIGGLPSGQRIAEKKEIGRTIFNPFQYGNIPKECLRIDSKSLKKFALLDGFKLLLCHNPEYFDKFIRAYDIDIICSGHAHGGQIRLFGQGIFASGQGFFPKYTSGIYENRLVVSRGLSNHSRVPRIWNAPEIVMLTVYG